MRLGISSFTFGWAVGASGSQASLNEVGLVAETRNFGLQCLQIGDNLPLHAMSPSRFNGLQNAANENNICLEVGARRLTEDHLHRYIDIAAKLKSPLLRFVVDGDGYEPEINTIISILKNVLPDLRKNGITLGIENHDRFKATELRTVIDAISDDHVGICLDSVNSIGAGEGFDWVADVLAPYTVNLHIKDFTIRRLPHNMGFTVAGAPAGKGMLDIPGIMKKLSRYARCQSAILEQWTIPEGDLDETIKKERQWSREGIQYLKGLPYFNTTISIQ